MAYSDLREWITRLEDERELARITASVDWDKEIGGITQKIFDEEGPALLFENIKGYEDARCRKLFTASLSTYSRIALMWGLPKETTHQELIQYYTENKQKTIKPVVVESGPVKENILKGDEVNLYDFPTPLWHDKDGGRYIGTFQGVVTKDPDSGWVNVGMYRMEVHDDNHTGITISHGQHIWFHYRKYRQMGVPMPAAVVMGWDQVLPAVSCSSQPVGVCEYDVMGGMRGEAVELVKCETVDLEVPASSEIVLEGEIGIDFDEFRMEGPFGEYTGYYAGEASKKPVFTVNCITHRNDPILQGTMEGIPINEDHRMSSVNHSGTLLEALNERMWGIKAVNVDPSTGWANVFVQVDNSYMGQVQQVGANIWSLGISNMVGKNVYVFDEDIDIFDLKKIMWALAYRVDPPKDIIHYPGWISPIDPIVHPDDKKMITVNRGTRLLVDATKPIENKRTDSWFGEKFPPVCYPDPDTMERVKERWGEYGLD